MMLSNEAPNARPVRKFTIQDPQDWMEWSGVSLGGVINEDETPGGKLGGIGFSRVPKGATKNFEFAYDEVLVITKGKRTVRTENETIVAQASEIIYLPAGTPGIFQADEDAELVYVAPLPSGEVNREMTVSLLNRKG